MQNHYVSPLLGIDRPAFHRVIGHGSEFNGEMFRVPKAVILRLVKSQLSITDAQIREMKTKFNEGWRKYVEENPKLSDVSGTPEERLLAAGKLIQESREAEGAVPQPACGPGCLGGNHDHGAVSHVAGMMETPIMKLVLLSQEISRMENNSVTAAFRTIVAGAKYMPARRYSLTVAEMSLLGIGAP